MTRSEDKRERSFTKEMTRVAQVKRSVENTARSLGTKIIHKVRTGPNAYYIVPPFARGGNWLYVWCKAFSQSRESGALAKTIPLPGMETWIEEFPLLTNLIAPSAKIPFRDLRFHGFNQDVERSFSAEDRQAFIEQIILSSDKFRNRIREAQKLITEDSLVISVRRGDYFSNPSINQTFGIDSVTYIRSALKMALSTFNPSNIIVTSDDLAWCESELSYLSQIAPTTFLKLDDTMFGDLAVLAAAHRLILTNTTFGYWGGYIADALNQAQVWVPSEHELNGFTDPNGRCIQHMAQWATVTPPQGGSWLSSQ